MNVLTFEIATLGHRDEVNALLGETYPALLAPDYDPDLLAAILPAITVAQDALLTCGSYYLCRDADGVAVAAGGWTRLAPGLDEEVTPGGGHVRHVVTRLGRTREGIGMALMAHIAFRAVAAGMTKLDCLSTLTAVPFYLACGYVRIGPVDVPVGESLVLPSLRMRRTL